MRAAAGDVFRPESIDSIPVTASIAPQPGQFIKNPSYLRTKISCRIPDVFLIYTRHGS